MAADDPAAIPRATWANIESGGANPTLAVLHAVAIDRYGQQSGRMVSLLRSGASVGAMLARGLAEYAPVVGASGVVFGLLGALIWLELRSAEDLPAWWRVPRRGRPASARL